MTTNTSQVEAARAAQPQQGMVWIEAGTFRMGSEKFYPEEAPVHRVTVDGFWIDPHPVTNAEFRRFVEATGHVTFAEIPPDPKEYPGIDPAVLEATAEATADNAEPAIRTVDAIIAEVNQTVVIMVTGDTGAAVEEPAQTASIAAPAAEPEDKTTSDASVSQPNEEKAGQASAAIVVEVTQSATVAVLGQTIEDEPVVTGSITEPSSTTPVSMLDGKNCDEDF